MDIDKAIYLIWSAMVGNPHPVLILAARWVMMEFDRDIIPDWIAMLAGGNPANWKKLIEETIREYENGYVRNDHRQSK